MTIAVDFIKWIFKKATQGLVAKHRTYGEYMTYNPWEAVFVWFIFTALSTVVVLLIFGAFKLIFNIDVPIEVWFLYIGSCFVYLIYTGFTVLYNAFRAERAHLFETIKNGR